VVFEILVHPPWIAIGGPAVSSQAPDQSRWPVPTHAPSDAFFLSCNVAFIVGFAILTQSSFGRVHASVRLDGAIAGLAIAAVAGVVWFEPVLHVSGRPFQAAVDLAYPVCALVLIVLLVAGLAPHRYRPNWTTILLMIGVAWSVAGSVIFLNQSAAGTYVAGTLLGETWLMSFFFIGLAASVRDRRRSGGARASVSSPAGIAVVPVVFGVVSLAVLATSIYRHDSSVVVILAIAALGLVICRMAVTLREVRQSMANYQDARTDYLTGLPNRRAFLERLESTLSPSQTPPETPGCCWSTSTVSRKSTMLWATPPATSSCAWWPSGSSTGWAIAGYSPASGATSTPVPAP
jgi:hypothetical protein